jgi:hypothetical protein
MPRGPELSPSTRSRIYSLRSDANLSYNDIAIRFPSIPRLTIIYIYTRKKANVAAIIIHVKNLVGHEYYLIKSVI